jgi:hypothetical protein
MSVLIPSPPQDASSTVRGLVSLVAQTFAGAKTFLATLVASAGIQLGLLFNTNGGGASDVVVKLGSSVADATVNAAAKLLSLRTGLNGGTEVESVYVTKSAIVFARNSASVLKWDSGGANSWQIEGTPGGAYLRLGNNAVQYFGLRSTDGFGVTSYGLEVNDVGLATPYFRVGGLYTGAVGRIDQKGANRAANPGSETQNAAVGINALASGATSVTITNSLVTASSRVLVTFHADPGGRYWVTRAAGSFTVNVSAAPGADAPFSWEVSTLL